MISRIYGQQYRTIHSQRNMLGSTRVYALQTLSLFYTFFYNEYAFRIDKGNTLQTVCLCITGMYCIYSFSNKYHGSLADPEGGRNPRTAPLPLKAADLCFLYP